MEGMERKKVEKPDHSQGYKKLMQAGAALASFFVAGDEQGLSRIARSDPFERPSITGPAVAGKEKEIGGIKDKPSSPEKTS